MKLSVTILLLFSLFIQQISAQAPQAVNYQAIARDALGKPLPDKDITVEFSIRDGSASGNVVYRERHVTETNTFGLFTLGIGQGAPLSGSFPAIDWAGGTKFLEVNIDNSLQGTTQLLSVPYALYAAKTKENQTLSIAGNQLSISEGNTVPLPTTGGAGTLNDLSDVNTAGVSNSQVLEWNGSQWVPANPAGDNWGGQAVQTSGNTLSGNGTGGSPLALAQQGAAVGQVLKWNGSTWAPALDLTASVVAGTGISVNQNGAIFTVTNTAPDQPVSLTGAGATTVTGAYPNFTVTTPVPADNSPTNEIQTLSLAGNTLSLSNGGSVTLPAAPTYTAGAGINITGTTVTNTGDTNAADDLTTSSQSGGDLSGPFSNLQIGANTIGSNELTNNAVGSNEIINGSVTAADLAAGVIPVTLPPSGAAGGDLSGAYPSPTVAKIQGRPVAATAPVDGQVLRYNGTAQQWEPVESNSLGWGLMGNSGTIPGINFIGTTDEQPISFKVDGVSRMEIDSKGRLKLVGESYTNTFVGLAAGLQNTPSVPNNYNGINNTFLGFSSGHNNTEGMRNTFLGNETGYFNTIGQDNCFTGSQAGQNNVTGFNNSFFGSGANNINGWQNSFFGRLSGYQNLDSDNSFFGSYSGFGHTTGSNNSFFGSCSGEFDTIGENNTLIGYDANSNNFQTVTALGSYSVCSSSNSARIGNTTITSIGGQVNWTAFSDARFKTVIKEEVKGLDFIRRLRPVTYQYDITKLDDFLGTTARRSERGDTLSHFEIESREKAASIRYTGFLAQEVEQAARELGFDFSGVDAPDNERDLYGLRYAEFTVPLVKAVQEQQVIIEAQQKQLEALQEQLLGLAAEVKALKEKR